jgi:hypothetical protein
MQSEKARSSVVVLTVVVFLLVSIGYFWAGRTIANTLEMQDPFHHDLGSIFITSFALLQGAALGLALALRRRNGTVSKGLLIGIAAVFALAVLLGFIQLIELRKHTGY